MSTTPNAVPARPWRPQDGAKPEVWTWPATDPPALWVRSGGAWRRATVMAKQVFADGRVRYQVQVDLRGDTTMTVQAYEWPPQPGLRVAAMCQFGVSGWVSVTAHQSWVFPLVGC